MYIYIPFVWFNSLKIHMYQLRNSKIYIVDYENCNEFNKCVTSIMKKIVSCNKFIMTCDQGNANKMDSTLLGSGTG